MAGMALPGQSYGQPIGEPYDQPGWRYLGPGSDGAYIFRSILTGGITRVAGRQNAVQQHNQQFGGLSQPQPAAAPAAMPMMPSMPTMPSMPSAPPTQPTTAPTAPSIEALAPSGPQDPVDMGSGAGAQEKGMGGLRGSLGTRIHPSMERLLKARAY